jgi:O-antigen/teichoic acid export membrane protein
LQSIRYRYVFSIGLTVARSGLALGSGVLLARLLGTEDYGRLTFLLGTFVAVRPLLDLGTSSAFFTFLSEERQSPKFVLVFLAWQALQLLMPLAFISLVLPEIAIQAIWQGESRALIAGALAATFAQNWFWPVVMQAGEAERRTVFVNTLAMLAITAQIVAVVALWFYGYLAVSSVYALLAIEYTAVSVVGLSRLSIWKSDSSSPRTSLRDQFRKFRRYCGPLVPLGAVTFGYLFVDRWLLQRFGGADQQAFYSVGMQFSSVALLGTTALLRILWKEVAEARFDNHFSHIEDLFRRSSRGLVMVAAGLGGLFVPWSAEILEFLYGSAYVSGEAALAILLIYPVHQSLGQVVMTVLYATHRSRLISLVGIGTAVVSGITSYFVMAPVDFWIPGLELGALGVAAKALVLQMVQINILLYVLSRGNGWAFDGGRHMIVLSYAVLSGFASYGLVNVLLGEGVWVIWRGVAATIIHCVFVGVPVYRRWGFFDVN